MELVVDNSEEKVIESIITMAKDENTRISACTNVEMNKKIFAIYERCVEPLGELEKIEEQMERDNRMLGIEQANLSSLKSKTKIASIVATVVMFVFVISNLKEVTDLNMIMALAIGVFYIYLIPMIMRKICKSRTKKVEKLEKEVDERNFKGECEARKIIDANSNMFALIPKDYRNYRAVRDMVKAYNSGKVDCIKEAVTCCDDNKYRENVSENLSRLTMYMTQSAIEPVNF